MAEEKENFERYKEVENTKLKKQSLILDSEKLQFDTYKNMTEKRIEIEKQDLQNKCDKFKEVMKGFQVKFDDLNEE